MTNVKDIEITVSNQKLYAQSMIDRCTDSVALVGAKAYLKGLDFCHQVIINKISYLEKKTYDDSMRDQS